MKKEGVDKLISAAASAMAKRRMDMLTPEQRSAMGHKGGKAGWAKLSPLERRLEMRRRGIVRWKKRVKKAKALREVK